MSFYFISFYFLYFTFEAMAVRAEKNKICVYWFGDHRISFLPCSLISSFEREIGKLLEKNNRPTLQQGIIEALKLFADRSCVQNNSSKVMSNEDLINWAKDGLPTLKYDLAWCEILNSIKVNLPLQKQNLTHGYKSKVQNMQRKNKRGNFCKNKETCMACFHDHVEHHHPIFTGYLCNECMYCCSVCGGFGRLLICSKITCLNTCCKKCIRVFVGKNMFNIWATKPDWYCFLCSSYQGSELRIRSDWKKRISFLFWNNNKKIDIFVPPIEKRVVVLSVSNGLTGIFNVRKLNFLEVTKLYHCCMGMVFLKTTSSRKNVILEYPVNIDDLGKLDMLIGGSSSLNDEWHLDVDDNDENFSVCAEFYRLLTVGQTQNPELFWAFECPATVPYELQLCLTRWFSCEPKVFDTNWENKLTRYRLWWGNFLMGEKLFRNGLLLPETL